MSYDFDDESANFLSEARNSERYSTMSSMVANYEHKISNISNELKMVSQKVTKKLKDYGKNRSEILSLYSNMIELSHHMNETIVKSKQAPESSGESQMRIVKWKNISLKYVKQIKTLEAAIFQKQKELDKLANVKSSKRGGSKYGKYNEDEDEMAELIQPECTGEEGKFEGLKLRQKETVQGETFEEFMKRRSKRITKLKESMEKINGLYHDLNDLANEQDEQINHLDFNMDKGLEETKKANKQLKKAKPKSMVNMRLVVSVIILILAIPLLIRWTIMRQ
ncbi:unnamed protein product [Moneuplotes crassus]|uniref:t-SNARE coiled-coil homology domain-containing protein n=2 Tax=Euplotes crassus TaxID=5936 RepID=A0AAD1XQU8_EUPCR|nr:unnamed protein product [Moneuplotes crassus]